MTKPTQRKITQPEKARSAQLFRISERDRDILRLVYQHRFLDTELLWYLIREKDEEPEYGLGADGKRRPRTYGFSRKALYKRLKQLTDAKCLKGLQSLPQRVGRGFGGARIAYGLGPKSASVLSETLGAPQAAIKDIVAANQVGAPFIQHALEVARFRVVLQLACRGTGGRVKLLFWEQGISLRDWIEGEDIDGGERRFSVYPDAFIGIEAMGNGRANYFLELDRGTMPIASSGDAADIRKKVFGYMLYRKAGRHRQRYRYWTILNGTVTGLHICNDTAQTGRFETQLKSIEYFRVLFIAQGATGGTLSPRSRVANMLGAFPSFGKAFTTTTLFWFASLDTFELEHPETIFGNVWFTPNPTHGLKSLIG